MNITIKQLKYICAVAELGSVQAASRRMRISPSSILAAIEISEAELGTRLFIRDRATGMKLTPAGQGFVAESGRLIGSALDFERNVGFLNRQPPSILRIGCFEPFGAIFMVEALRILRKREPNIEINLFEADQIELLDLLKRGAVDIVVTYDLGPSFGDSVTKICRIPAHVLVSRDTDLAYKKCVSLREVAEQPIVLLDHPQTSTYLLTLFDFVGVKPRVGFRTKSYETVRAAVAAGIGPAILNMRPVGKSNPDIKNLVRIPLRDELPAPILLIADPYSNLKPVGVKLIIETIMSLFSHDSLKEFVVVTPERERIVFDV